MGKNSKREQRIVTMVTGKVKRQAEQVATLRGDSLSTYVLRLIKKDIARSQRASERRSERL